MFFEPEKLRPGTTSQAVTEEAARHVGEIAQRLRERSFASEQVAHFLDRLASLKVLDPACGSGNFLFVTLGKLKDLEKEVVLFSMEHGLGMFPRVGPWQLYGIEVNPYAFELAQMTVWIGYLQCSASTASRCRPTRSSSR